MSMKAKSLKTVRLLDWDHALEMICDLDVSFTVR